MTTAAIANDGIAGEEGSLDRVRTVDVRLYGVSLSYPSRAARLMLQHKGIRHEWVKLAPGVHPFRLRLAGFRGVLSLH